VQFENKMQRDLEKIPLSVNKFPAFFYFAGVVHQTFPWHKVSWKTPPRKRG
jgi:hypothetical protein